MKRGLLFQMVIPVILVIVIGIPGIWFLIPSLVKEKTRRNAVRTAEQTVQQFKILRGYYTRNVISKVVAEGSLTPHFEHREHAGNIPLPATMIHDLSALLSDSGLQIRLSSRYPFPNRKDRRLDSFEELAWDALKENPDDTFVLEEEIEGEHFLRVAIADTMSAAACVNCHNNHPQTPKADWKLGDVRGVLEVTTSLEQDLIEGREMANQIVLILGLGGLFFVAVIFFNSKRISQPLSHMASTMLQLAEGNEDVTLTETNANQELSELASAMLEFKETIAESKRLEKDRKDQEVAAREREETLRRQQEEVLAREKQKQADNFRENFVTVVSQVEEASAAMMEMADKLAEVSTETTAQSEAALTKVKDNIQFTDNISSMSEALSNSLGETADQSSNVSETARKAMNQADDSNRKITSLASAGERIGGVLRIINNIAEKTNLLALNASIEAARAGEAGRGFAVVANEVKGLSNQSADATGEIGGQVTEMQGVTGEVVKAMEESRNTIEALSRISEDIHSGIETQNEETRAILNTIGRVTNNSKIEQELLENLHRAASENAEMANQVQACAQRLSESTSKLETSVEIFLKES